MATILDVSLLQSFDIIFPAILVFAIVFAVLQKYEVIGKSPGINAIVAVMFSLLVLISDTAVQILKFIIPWFTIAAIFFVLIILTFMIFGLKSEDIATFVKNDKGIGWVIVGFSLVILIAGGASVFGQNIGPYLEGGSNATTVNGVGNVATGNFQTNVMATLFHPKVLGLMILFGIFIFAIALLTGKS